MPARRHDIPTRCARRAAELISLVERIASTRTGTLVCTVAVRGRSRRGQYHSAGRFTFDLRRWTTMSARGRRAAARAGVCSWSKSRGLHVEIETFHDEAAYNVRHPCATRSRGDLGLVYRASTCRPRPGHDAQMNAKALACRHAVRTLARAASAQPGRICQP